MLLYSTRWECPKIYVYLFSNADASLIHRIASSRAAAGELPTIVTYALMQISDT